MEEHKKWYQSRTVWLAIAQGVAGIMAAVFAVDPALQDVGYLAILKSVLDFLLRANTIARLK